MKLTDIPITYQRRIKTIYRDIYHKPLNDDGDLVWIQRRLDRVNDFLSQCKSDNTRKGYTSAVKYVLDHLKETVTDVVDRYVDYRERNKDNEEWKVFNNARTYIAKLNKKTSDATPKNSLIHPSDKATDKYGLYNSNGKWFSTVVDAYYQTHDNERIRH